jgi:hypothetical protein
MDEITVEKLHTTEMVKSEVRDMLCAGEILLTLGMVEGLWLVDSPYVKGGNVTETDIESAMKICCVENMEPLAFHKALSAAIDTACRPYEIIVPEKDDGGGKHSEVPTFSPEWFADQISMACQAMPSLTMQQILWETPFVFVTHLAVSTARRHGAITRRPDDIKAALKILKERKKNKRENNGNA